MILPIEVYGSPVLRTRSVDIDSDYPELQQFIADMWETMYHADGVGLAAPQVGRNIRIIVIDANSIADEDPSLEGFKKVLINPYIKQMEGAPVLLKEGCLSLPGIREEVPRKPDIDIEYYDESFRLHKEHWSGMKARIVQHEFDHLEAILFIDRLAPIKRKLLRARLTGISKGNVEVAYKIKTYR